VLSERAQRPGVGIAAQARTFIMLTLMPLLLVGFSPTPAVALRPALPFSLKHAAQRIRHTATRLAVDRQFVQAPSLVAATPSPKEATVARTNSVSKAATALGWGLSGASISVFSPIIFGLLDTGAATRLSVVKRAMPCASFRLASPLRGAAAAEELRRLLAAPHLRWTRVLPPLHGARRALLCPRRALRPPQAAGFLGALAVPIRKRHALSSCFDVACLSAQSIALLVLFALLRGLALASVVALSALAIGAGFFARLNFAPMRALGAAQARHASSLRLLSARRRRVAGRTSGRGVCCRRQRGAAPGASRRHGCLRRRSAWAQRTARRVHCGVAWLLRHGVVDGLLAHTRTRTQTRLPFLFLGREAHFQHPPRTR